VALAIAIACGSCSNRPVQGVLVPVSAIAEGDFTRPDLCRDDPTTIHDRSRRNV
jgi:hypothetical protein